MKVTRRGIFGVIAAAVLGHEAVAAPSPAKKIWRRRRIDEFGPYWQNLNSCRHLKNGDLFMIGNDSGHNPNTVLRADSDPRPCNDGTGDWGICYLSTGLLGYQLKWEWPEACRLRRT